MKRIWFLVVGVILVLGIGAGLVFGLGNGPKTYTVEITSNVEQIEYESKNNCRLGDTIIIEAIPIEGYRFIGWEVNDEIVSDEEKYEIILNEDNVDDEYKAIYEKLTFNITMPTTQTGYTINDTNNGTFTTMVVEYGDSISFKVELKTGYTGTPVVKNNRQTITADNDVYTISNVTSDVNITITGVKRITYTVTLPSQQTGYTIKNANNLLFDITSVKYGDSISFKVVLNTGYNGTPIVRNNNDLLTPSNDIYTISNVNSDVNITVEGITANAYTLTFPEEVTVTRNNIQLTSGATIYYGDILTLSPTTAPAEGITPVYAINGTETTCNNITVADNVTIEYFEVMNASEYQTLTFTYNESAKTAEVKANSSNKPTGEIVVPSKVIKDANGLTYEVRKVGSFESCTGLTEITIPNSVTSIGTAAFYGCSSLTSITIPNSVTSIGTSAFFGCSSLTSITIPSNVIRLGADIFSGCRSLTSVTIGSGVTSIGDRAFEGCRSLTSVTIPNSVTSIGYRAFNNCISLTSVTIGSGVSSIGDSAFSNCSSLTSVTIPGGVTSIGDSAFHDCSSLTSVTIGSGVSSIGDQAFYNCFALAEVYNKSALSITKGSGIAKYAEVVYSGETIDTPTKIYFSDDGVAYYKESDTSYIALKRIDKTKTTITLDSRTTKITQYAFYNCSSITSITIPDGVTSIGNSAFRYCSGLTDITIPNGVTSIGNWAFYNCSSLTDITIPNSVTSIGNNAFNYCSSLTSITIPNSVTSIGSYAFSDCGSLTSVTISNSITSIDIYTFSNCSSLTSITIPNSVTSMGERAFSGCSSLTSITIPSNVISLGAGIFSGCSSLESMTLPFVGGSAKTATDTYQYPFGYLFGTTSYDGSTGVRQYYYGSSTSSTINITYYIPSLLRSVTITGGNILYGAFYGCSMLTSVTIPNSVTSIGDRAFINCSSLTSITIPSSVTSIGSYAFYNCSGFTSITIPDEVTSIGSYAFYGCSGLTSITISSSVTSIGEYAFKDCTKLYIVNNLSGLNITKGSSNCGWVGYYAHLIISEEFLDEKIEELDGVVYYKESANSYKAAYLADTAKTSITLDENTTEICYKASYNCGSLTSITIPSSVTSIGDSAFYNCRNLTTVTFGANSQLSRIGSHAFFGCSSLTSVTIPNSVTSIGSSAFYNCSSITSVTIGSGVTSIGDQAFYNCLALAEVYNRSALTITERTTDKGYVAYYAEVVYSGDTINTPTKIEEIDRVKYYKESDTSYIALKCIDKTKTTINLDSRTTKIRQDAFSGCINLTSITIPNSVTSIGDYAFNYCSSLTSVTIPNGVTSIGTSAFEYCSSLTDITIPSSIASIDYGAFVGCTSLTSVTFENPNGWFVADSSTATSGTDVALTDPEANATYLKTTYYNKYWKRSA